MRDAGRHLDAPVPELLAHLARLGAHDIQLAGWTRRVRRSTGILPREWDGLLDSVAGARAHDPQR